MFSNILTFLCFSTLVFAAPVTKIQGEKKGEFRSFTGKLTANKVRIRAKADLDSPIIRQMNKNDLLLVVGESNNFYEIEPLKDSKAYVFRSYVLDNIVEGSRINVRLEPHIDAPIIAQLQLGDRVEGYVSAVNNKWLEIKPPKSSHFYIAKDYVENVGGPEYLVNMEKRKAQVDDLLSSTYMIAEAECNKDYEEMAPEHPAEQFQTIISNFPDFPDCCKQAKEGLALLKETYLKKKITYLESKAEISAEMKEELLAKHKKETSQLSTANLDSSLWTKKLPQKKEDLSFWGTLEESLYLSWSAFHSGRTFEDYYTEQRANALVITGKIERYTFQIQNKPGDYILRGREDAPIAYLYSTKVNLDSYEGKQVTILASPRPNNHFAFPAYFVFSIE